MNRIFRSDSVKAAMAAGVIAATLKAGSVELPCPPTHLTAGPGIFASFGFSVAIEGEIAVVGINPILCCSPGAAYVFRRGRGSAWVQEQVLIPSDGVAGDSFGRDVAVEGGWVLVSANQHVHESAPGSGAVYAFLATSDGWIEQQELLASTGSFGDSFGRSVDISGNVAIAGAAGDDGMGQGVGAAYMYRFNGAIWIEEQKLFASDPRFDSSFGGSVAICGDIALVGCPGDNLVDENEGSAYVFRFDGSRWIQEQKLTAINATRFGGDMFGWAVDLSCDSQGNHVAIVSAKFDDQPGLGQTGSAYIFRRDGRTATWQQEQELLPQSKAASQYGESVAIDGDWAVVGDDNSSLAALDHGAVHVYHYEGRSWSEVQTLLPTPSTMWFPIFGHDVALDGNIVITGAHGEMQQAGSAYIYNIDPIFADLNCDNHVNGLDLGILLRSWGPVSKGNANPLADLDGNGIVNGFDLAMLLGEWG